MFCSRTSPFQFGVPSILALGVPHSRSAAETMAMQKWISVGVIVTGGFLFCVVHFSFHIPPHSCFNFLHFMSRDLFMCRIGFSFLHFFYIDWFVCLLLDCILHVLL